MNSCYKLVYMTLSEDSYVVDSITVLAKSIP